MPVRPIQLQGVAADLVPSPEFKALVGVADIWPNDIPEHVRLAPASRARAGLAQKTQREKCLRSILPFDGQLTPDLLDVDRLEAHQQSLSTHNREAM